MKPPTYCAVKTKLSFTPHVDTGDFVIITNAEKVVLTGNKEGEKIYTRYTGYVGNQKVETPKQVRARRPELLLERAVRGMVPHNKLGDAIFQEAQSGSGCRAFSRSTTTRSLRNQVTHCYRATN